MTTEANVKRLETRRRGRRRVLVHWPADYHWPELAGKWTEAGRVLADAEASAALADAHVCALRIEYGGQA